MAAHDRASTTICQGKFRTRPAPAQLQKHIGSIDNQSVPLPTILVRFIS